LIKIWGGNGKRAARRKAAGSRFGLLGVRKRTAKIVAEKKTHAATNQERIIDFETLLSWYNANNPPAAVGDEFSQAFLYARKQKKLKFL